MNAEVTDFAVFGHALAATLYGVFLIYLLISGRLRAADAATRLGFLLVVAVSAAWAGVAAQSLWAPSPPLDGAARALDLARYGLWFAFLQRLLHHERDGAAPPTGAWLRAVSLGAVAAASVLLILRIATGGDERPSQLEIGLALVLPVCGLLLVEQLFRNLGEASRWNAKPLCLGLACLFAFDIYLYSEALLFSRFDIDAMGVRGAIHALAVPFLFVASRRGKNWINRLQVSRAAAFYSATLLLAGSYLLFMAGIGYYIRYFGGSWGRGLQLSLLILGLVLLATMLLSRSARSWLRVFVGKHFFRYRYDYRAEWLNFTTLLSANRSPRDTGEMIVRGLAGMVECPAGSLWTRAGTDGHFTQAVCWNSASVSATESADASLCNFLRTAGWVIDLDEFRAGPKRYPSLVLPTWLLGTHNGWLVVPLLAGDELHGFVLLLRPMTTIKLNWEVLDLLKTAGRQAAGYLAQMQATEALLEARKFDAFNKMSAFVVHDLKNIVAQLSLMLRNAERLHDNREFQEDMLLTVASSLEKMKRLMLQLREGATPPGGSHGVELSTVMRKLASLASSQGRQLEIEDMPGLSTRGHEERLERVLGHLVQNALDATPPSGRVWVKTGRHSGQVRVEVGDTGSGMSEDFVRTRLFRPFNTTKMSGMGIGSYESFQYVRELGGQIDVDSTPGRGPGITVLLPLFEVARGDDWLDSTRG